MRFRKFIVGFYAFLFMGMVVFAGIFFLRTYQELQNLKRQEAATQVRLAERERRLAELERTFDLLQRDPAFVERVIRQRLGYARPNEVLFRFED